MSSMDYWRKLYAQYVNEHPSGVPSGWQMPHPSDIVAGNIDGYSSEDFANQALQDKQFQNWLGSLTPEQRTEYEAATDERNAKNSNLNKLMMAAAAAGFGGIAASGMGLGGLGATSAVEGIGGAGSLGAYTTAAADSALASSLGGYTGLGASAIPSAVNLGTGLGGIMETGVGALGVGASAGGAFSSVGDYIKSLGTSLGKDALKGLGGDFLSQLISAGTNAYMGNKQAGQYGDVLKQINELYAPDSPYAKQMQQAMARKDAAAGRNSQYGTRAVELAAALTNSKANALTSAGYGNLMMQQGINQNIPWNGFLAALGSKPGQDLITKAGGNVGSWLGGLFGSGGDKITPTTPNTGGNWWENWGGYIGGGP